MTKRPTCTVCGAAFSENDSTLHDYDINATRHADPDECIQHLQHRVAVAETLRESDRKRNEQLRRILADIDGGLGQVAEQLKAMQTLPVWTCGDCLHQFLVPYRKGIDKVCPVCRSNAITSDETFRKEERIRERLEIYKDSCYNPMDEMDGDFSEERFGEE